jgi:hypothetical protein
VWVTKKALKKEEREQESEVRDPSTQPASQEISYTHPPTFCWCPELAMAVAAIGFKGWKDVRVQTL